MSPPKIDEVGKMFEKGTSFCSVGDPEHLRVVMPVATKDYRILEDDWEREKALGRDLGVTIRVKGSGNRIWQGRIKDLPKSDAKDVPEQLTTKYGGPIAAKPSQNPHVHAPASQQFLIYVDLIDPDEPFARARWPT